MYIVYNLREIAEICNIDKIYNGLILFDEKIAPRTTFKVGGIAPIFFEPNDIKSLQFVLSLLQKKDVPFFILGGGSNIVVSDEGFDGAVISTNHLNEVSFEQTDDFSVVKAFAGSTIQKLVKFCSTNALSGIEPFSGLPGTVGGAVFMNARCFNLSLSDVLLSVDYLEASSNYELKTYQFNPSDWDYKKSPFSDGEKIIVSAKFRLNKMSEKNRSEIENACKDFMMQRVGKGHFKYPCAGSVFKNNHDFGFPTGKIIDELGLKGYEIGGAQVAPWHGNIIINKNHATQNDISELVSYIINVVYEKKGFTLEPEIIFCGKKKN